MNGKKGDISAAGGGRRTICSSMDMIMHQGNAGLYGERLLTCLELAAWTYHNTGNGDLGNGMTVKTTGDRIRLRQVTMPLRMLDRSGNRNNYDKIAESLRKLTTANILIRKKNGDFRIMNLVSSIDYTRGILTALVEEPIWERLTEYSIYRRYDPDMALQLGSQFSLRLYRMVSGQEDLLDRERPYMRMDIDELKKTFYGKDWTRTDNATVMKILRRAQKELDGKADWSFTTETTTKAQESGRPTIESVILYPRRTASEPTEKPREERTAIAVAILEEDFGFTRKDINDNMEAIRHACATFDLPTMLRKTTRKCKQGDTTATWSAARTMAMINQRTEKLDPTYKW